MYIPYRPLELSRIIFKDVYLMILSMEQIAQLVETRIALQQVEITVAPGLVILREGCAAK